MSEYVFDDRAADDAVLFFERFLRHVKGEWTGTPIVLEQWQRDEIIRPLFGWKLDAPGTPEHGLRRYRTLYAEVPRKNAKSTLSAGIALKLLTADGEPGAEVYSAASDKDQARIVFGDACEMVRRSPELSKRCKVYKNAISVPSTGSTYRVLSSEAFTKDGLSAHGIIFDEVHAQPNRELWDVLTTSTGARRQPLVVAITTAGFDRKSLCWTLHLRAEKVRDGLVDLPSFLPVVYSAGPDEDWTSEETWRKANPNLGVSLKLRELQELCATAKDTPAEENAFRRLHLNQWTEQDIRWMPMAKWDACGAEAFDETSLAGMRCFGGLDLASETDVAALVWVFPVPGAPVEGAKPGEAPPVEYRVLPRFWIPEEGLRRRVARDKTPYDAWLKRGLIRTTPGEVIDYEYILRQIGEDAERFDVAEVAFDRWGATKMVQSLDRDGMKVIPFGQGFASMAHPTKELMVRILQGRIHHGGNEALRWMASNVVVEQDAAGNVKPSKKKSSEKIDGIVALVMGLDRALRDETPKKSYLGTRPIIAFG
mgnify:CR=1 FL=1